MHLRPHFLSKVTPRGRRRPNVESNSSRVRRSNITMGAKKKSLFSYRLRSLIHSQGGELLLQFRKLNVFSSLILPHF